MNRPREAAGQELLQNPRNAAAGALRQLDPAEARRRRLRFFGYQVVPLSAGWHGAHHHEALAQLAAWGFPGAPGWSVPPDLAAGQAHVAGWSERIRGLPLDARGLGDKDEAVRTQEGVGVIGGAGPRWCGDGQAQKRP